MDPAAALLDAFADARQPAGALDSAEASGRTWGVVTVASPLQVKFSGDTAGVRVTQKLASYTPVLSDVVVLLKVGSKWVCVGKIGSA